MKTWILTPRTHIKTQIWAWCGGISLYSPHSGGRGRFWVEGILVYKSSSRATQRNHHNNPTNQPGIVMCTCPVWHYQDRDRTTPEACWPDSLSKSALGPVRLPQQIRQWQASDIDLPPHEYAHVYMHSLHIHKWINFEQKPTISLM